MLRQIYALQAGNISSSAALLNIPIGGDRAEPWPAASRGAGERVDNRGA